ncbi:MAG TPA: hypothetical protein VNL77_09175 [Roseiflexaceae bacterium]|nr:hypothetical protein [Roseiflexaceae bacterium]
MAGHTIEEWDLWYPQAGATGLPFARGRLAPAEVLLVHAAPPLLTVTVRDGAGRQLARGNDLPAGAETPIARLTRHGERVEREDIWPAEDDIGRPVLLPGGEVGVLLRWWHAEDHSAWRWQIELSNRRQ